MAIFTLNIENIKPTYSRVTTFVQVGDCVLLDDTYPVQLESIADAINFSIIKEGTYATNAWKTLHISGVNSSNPNFVLKYNGVQIVAPIDIGITGFTAGQAIPLLTVSAVGYSDINVTHTITVAFAISDVNDEIGPYLFSSMQLVGIAC